MDFTSKSARAFSSIKSNKINFYISQHAGNGVRLRQALKHTDVAARVFQLPCLTSFTLSGRMQNRIKDQQLGLFAHRASSHRWWNNQFRQLPSGLAYVLFEGLRRLALQNTSLATAALNTIRLLLLIIVAVIIRNTRRVRILLSSACPHNDTMACQATILARATILIESVHLYTH